MRHHFGIGTPKQAAASILRGLIALLFGLHGGAIRLFRAFRPRAHHPVAFAQPIGSSFPVCSFKSPPAEKWGYFNRLLGNLANASGNYPITSANNQGIWAVNTSGTLQLIVQKGTFHPVTGKLITALCFLPAVPYDAGQTRSFDQATGDIVYRATFKDGTSGVFTVVFP